jgi:hypothetical protein
MRELLNNVLLFSGRLMGRLTPEDPTDFVIRIMHHEPVVSFDAKPTPGQEKRFTRPGVRKHVISLCTPNGERFLVIPAAAIPGFLIGMPVHAELFTPHLGRRYSWPVVACIPDPNLGSIPLLLAA